MRSAWIALGLLGCTNQGVAPIDDIEVNVVDDLLEVRGQLCSDPPEATDFPVKILFIIDGSGSMQFVDNPTRRALAVEEVILRQRANPSVSFAIIRFNESDAVLTKPGAEITAADPFGVDLSGAFTRDPAILQDAVRALQVADSVTDYQGALSTAFLVLFQDMLATSAAELARTKYVVMFLSDGDPFPQCCSERSQAQGICQRDTNIFFCEDPDAIRQNPTQLPFLEAQEDYNQPYQIYASVQDIVDLATNFKVGELRIHTAFLFDPTLVGMLDARGCYVIAGVNFVCPEPARELLGTVAQLGDGVFRDFSRAEEIDFLSFDLTNIRRENALKNLIVWPSNSIPTRSGLELDSDGDGLSDALEFEQGMNRLNRDSDGDGYQDALEWRERRNGLDPLRVNPGCSAPADRADVDYDGLARCEEVLLNTSTELFDTDADGIPDGLEVIAGTDPARSDILIDSDLDGVRNGDELRFHTAIDAADGTLRTELGLRYRVEDLGVNAAQERCYDFRIRNIHLVTPLGRPGDAESFGRNDLLMYFAQSPLDDPEDFGRFKMACVRARYVPPDYKDPPSGVVDLVRDDWKDPDVLDLDADCRGLTPPVMEAP